MGRQSGLVVLLMLLDSARVAGRTETVVIVAAEVSQAVNSISLAIESRDDHIQWLCVAEFIPSENRIGYKIRQLQQPGAACRREVWNVCKVVSVTPSMSSTCNVAS